MFAKLFGFRGRIGRLSYAGWALLASTLWAVWLFAVFTGLALGAVKGSLGAVIGSALLALIGFVPVIWMFLALAAKRLRDAGFPPLLVLPPVIAFSLLDTFVLSRQAGSQALALFPHNTTVGLSVNLVFGLVLLFWPSAEAAGDGEDGGATRSGDVPWHERALAAAASLPPEPAPVSHPSPVRSLAAPRTFGRRKA